MDDVSHKREKLECCPPGHADHYVAFYNLASGLRQKFLKELKIDDLDEAITLYRDSLELRPVENEEGNQSDSLQNLAVCLWNRYENLGTVNDSGEAITIESEALALRPPGHPDRDASLHNLGFSLRMKFEKQAEVYDLEEVVLSGSRAHFYMPVTKLTRLLICGVL